MINICDILFVVDGPSDAKSFKEKFCKIYKRHPGLRTVGCNGKDVDADGYANSSLGIILLALRGRYKYIFCILDKEERKISTKIFARGIKDAIIKKVLSCSKFSKDELESKINICIPDMMFENWIIADVKGIKRKKTLIETTARQINYEGKNGASRLDLMMLVKYKKTIHAPILFKSISFQRAKENSISFYYFTKCLTSCT